MSIILDALRVGSGKPPAGAISAPAQTDAILQTLGYGRHNPSPLDRLRRLIVYLGAAVVFTVLLAAAAIWLAERLESPNGNVIFFPDAPIRQP